MRRQPAEPAPAPDPLGDEPIEPPGPGGGEPDPSVRSATKPVTPIPWDHEGPDDERVEPTGESPGEGGEQPEGGAEPESPDGGGAGAEPGQGFLDAEAFERLKVQARKNPELARALGAAVLGLDDPGPEPEEEGPKVLSDDEVREQFYATLKDLKEKGDPHFEYKAMRVIADNDARKAERAARQREREIETRRHVEGRRTVKQIDLEKKHPSWRNEKPHIVAGYRAMAAEIGEAAYELPPTVILDHILAERARAGGPRATKQEAAVRASETKKATTLRAAEPVPNGRPPGPLERPKPTAEQTMVEGAMRHIRRSLPRLPG